MAGYNTSTLRVPMEVQMQIKNLVSESKRLSNSLNEVFANVNVDSTLGKQLTKLMTKVENGFSAIEASTLGTDLFDEAELIRVEKLIATINKNIQEMGVKGKRASAAQLGLNLEEIQKAQDELQKLTTAYANFRNTSIANRNPAELARFQKTSKATGFDASKSYTANINTLEKAEDKTIGHIAELDAKVGDAAKELQTAALIYKNAVDAQTKANQEFSAAQAKVEEYDQAQTQLTVAERIREVATGTKKGRGKPEIIKEYNDILAEQVKDHSFVDGGAAFAQVIASWLGQSDAAIEQLMAKEADEIISNLQQALTQKLSQQGQLRLLSNQANATISATQYDAAAHNAAVEEAAALQTALAAKNAEVERAESEVSTAKNNVNKANETLEEAKALLAEIQEQIKLLQELRQQLDKEAEQNYSAKIANQRAKVTQVQQDTVAPTQAEIVEKTSAFAAVNSEMRNLSVNRQNINTEAIEAQREADTFKQNLQQSIKHWMSAQQIINYIKDGMRQAYQDVKSLDAAMTNIAVVTDMSVGDLWGKINDYMAIAQQYGVTTQGVYEVSQLYYQQGLGTAEVMDATTETLKMARIAGMDYAEAADAMTVAIRAFKMEMSDAQHVTDVYSKVAAVTASDTEELAIAMSKTASSAESVGSSFENTTAMLAVMVETTRESAQNLGSALKSIISRYGEMKVGLTVDSEGEEIDYNKTDTALKSVGISLKDAQGQFRDFDEVIFELSEKWDSLDKNTQRYLATIMAGNRQQSRFIALVDNWERLDEVATSAQDSEDAGLIQYAKTLDSLESKLANVKTSFQQFYMSVFNGPLVSKIIDFINDIIQGFNHLSKFTTILNIGSIVSGIKLIGTILVNTFSSGFGQISAGWKQMLNELALSSRVGGRKAGENYVAGTQEGKAAPKLSRKATIGVSALSLVGTGLSMAGSAVAGKNQEAGTVMSSLGSGLQIGTMVGMINPIAGVVTGALAAIISGIASWPSELEKAQQNLEKAKEAANEANIKRAETKNRYDTLNNYLDKLEELERTRFDSAENEQAWIDLNAEVAENFSELAIIYDNQNNTIIDLVAAEKTLEAARLDAVKAAKQSADAQIQEAYAQQKEAQTQREGFVKTIGGTLIGSVMQTGDGYNISGSEEVRKAFTTAGIAYDGDGKYGIFDSVTDDLYAYHDWPFDRYALGTRNTLLADILPFLDATNVDALNWAKQLANINDPLEFLSQATSTYSQSYFQEDIPEKTIIQALSKNQYSSYEELIDALQKFQNTPEVNAQLLESTIKSGISAYIDASLLGLNSDSFIDLPNVKGMLAEEIYTKFQGSGQDWETWSTSSTGYLAAFTDLKTNFTQFYDSLVNQDILDDFNTLISSADSGIFGRQELENEFITMFGDSTSEWSTVVQDYYNDYLNNFDKSAEKLEASLSRDTREFDWDTATRSIIELNSFIQSIPQQYHDEITDFADSIDSRIEAETLNETQADIIVDAYIDLWSDIGSQGLFAEDLTEARAAIANADLFSITGITSLISELKELGVDTTELGLTAYDEATGKEVSNFPIYAANLVTEYQSLTDTVTNGIHSMSEWLDKAATGMDLEDASKLAKMMDTNLADTESFEFIDGEWYAKNIDTVKGALEKQYNSTLIALNEETARQVGLIRQYQTKPSTLSDINTKEVQDIIKRYEDNALAWGKKNKKDTDKIPIEDLVIQYIEAEQKALTAVYNQELAWIQAEAERSLKLASEARRIDEQAFGGLDKQRRTEAQQLLASKGLEGYTSEEIATFAQDLGFENIQAILSEDGTYRLNLTDEQIKQLPIFIQNTINNLIQSTADQAIEDLEGLGKDAGSLGFTNVQWTEVFTKASQERINYAIQAVLLGDSKLLEGLIAEQYNLDIDSPEVKQAVNSFIASIKDSRDETVLTYFELSEKKLAGTLTASEELELTAIEQAGYTWTEEVSHAINNSGTTIFEKYSILMTSLLSQGLPWDNIEDQLSAYFDNALEDYIKMGLQQSSDNISVTKSISDSENLLDDKTLKEFYLAYVETVGQDAAASFIDFMSMFTRNADTGEWSWDSTTIDGLPDIFKQALEKGVDTEELNKAIKADELRTSFAESYTEFMSDLTTVTLDDAKSLYESVFGEGSFLKAGWAINKETGKVEINEEIQAWEQYQEAIQQAVNGDTTLLESLISIIYSAAQTGIGEFEGIAVDSTRIAATLEDARNEAINAILDSIQAAFEGSLSRMDMVDLGEKLGISNVESYFTQTIEGYQATEEGMLKLGSAMVDKFGNAYNVAEQMYDLFVGEEALYSGYEDLELAAEGLTKEAENLKNVDEQRSKELSTQASILEHMANISRQMADDATFDFMGQDATSGLTQNADTFVESIDKVKDAFESFSNKEPISYQDFYNMMDFMNNQIGWDALREKLGVTKMSYEDFVNTVVAGSDEIGKVDMDAVAKLGVSVESMSEGMQDSIKAVAEDQIAYLKGLRNMLTAMSALEDIGEISIPLGFKITGQNGKVLKESLTFEDILNWDTIASNLILQGASPEQMQQVSINLDDYANQLIETYQQTFADAFKGTSLEGFMGDFIFNLFNGDGEGFSLSSEADKAAAQSLLNWSSTISGLSEDQLLSVGSELFSSIIGDDGKLIEGWQNKLKEYLDNLDVDNLVEVASLEIQQKLNNSLGNQGVTIKGNKITFNPEIITEDNEAAGWSSLKDEIVAAYEAQYPDRMVKFTINSDTEVIAHIIPKEVQQIVDAKNSKWVWQGDSESGESNFVQNISSSDGGQYVVKISATGEVNVTTSDNKDLAQEAEEAVLKEAGFTTGENGNLATKTVDGEVKYQITTTAEVTDDKTLTDIYNLFTGTEGITVNVNTNAEAVNVAETLETIRTEYDKLKEAEDININVTVPGVTTTDSTGTSTNVNDLLNIESPVSAEIIPTVQSEGAQDVTNLKTDLGEIKGEHIVGFQVQMDDDEVVKLGAIVSTVNDLEAKDPTITVTADTTAAQEPLDEVTTELDGISQGANATITADISEEEKTEVSDFSDIVYDLDNTFDAVITATETGAKEAAEAIDAAAVDRTSTIFVKQEYQGSTNQPPEQPGVGSSASSFIDRTVNAWKKVTRVEAKGNVALATGTSLDKLYSGAALAQGTLMGELGPELYVQGGHYYIAGANGPEFVDLANDAIVFNHLQTKSLLNRGQTSTTGSPVTSERRAVGAYATGNVKGAAFASGTDAAIAAIDRAIAVWQNILDVSTKDLVDAAGGGGGGGDTKAHIEDLEEWYNLSRKIANVEQEINNIIAERENMADGHEYLRSLRLQQELLQEQIGYQETLLNYQELQLKRQADIINTDKLWSQFIHVDETGLLQYNKGNEINGGKGALEVLQDLNEMSGKDQIAFLDKIGYKYTTTDGEELEGSDLVAKFFEELQKQIDEYDALYDTVHETNETIENLKTNIEEINQEVIDNQLELETEIYDLIVEACEKEIEKMEEYADKVEEANQKYIDGLQDALDAEKDLYNKNQSIDDRETLQRQLALLRRSGGSASEIANLEAELDNMLKDEYFANQQEAIDNIQKVNEAQLEALQQQIQLEEDALAFQQEHGLIWNQVNEIMQGGFDSMMNFFTAKDNEFFEASALAQIEKLDDWAKRVGIYDEDQAHQKHEDKAAANYWDNNAIWSDASLAGMQQVFNGMADGDKKAIKDTFLNAYANAKMSGKSEDEAKAAGINSITSALNAEKERQARAAQQAVSKPAQSVTTTPTPSEPAKPETRYVYMWAGTPDGEGKVSRLKRYGLNITADAKLADARRIITGYIKRAGYLPSSSTVYGFSEGGLVDYTGPAIVHGTPARPEGFLNAEQTAQIREALAASGDSTLLNILRSVASQLKVVSGAVSNSVSNNRSIEIAQGAVQVQVGTLANSYDVEDLSNDIMGRIVAIADKSTNRSVGRR